MRLYLGADSVEVLESHDGLRLQANRHAHFRRRLHHDLSRSARSRSGATLQAVPPGVLAAVRSGQARRVCQLLGRRRQLHQSRPRAAVLHRQSARSCSGTRGSASTSSTRGPSTTTPRTSAASAGSRPTIRSSPGPIARPTTTGCFSASTTSTSCSRPTAEDDPHSDIYYNAATIYPWAADVHLMFTAQFRHFSPEPQSVHPAARARASGRTSACSKCNWPSAATACTGTRPSREPYFPTGLADEWDRWYAVMGPGIVRRGNYLYQYYNSSGRLHDSVGPAARVRRLGQAARRRRHRAAAARRLRLGRRRSSGRLAANAAAHVSAAIACG